MILERGWWGAWRALVSSSGCPDRSGVLSLHILTLGRVTRLGGGVLGLVQLELLDHVLTFVAVAVLDSQLSSGHAVGAEKHKEHS